MLLGATVHQGKASNSHNAVTRHRPPEDPTWVPQAAGSIRRKVALSEAPLSKSLPKSLPDDIRILRRVSGCRFGCGPRRSDGSAACSPGKRTARPHPSNKTCRPKQARLRLHFRAQKPSQRSAGDRDVYPQGTRIWPQTTSGPKPKPCPKPWRHSSPHGFQQTARAQ